MLKNILAKSTDLAAIVFYNTEKSPPPKEVHNNTHLFPANCAIFSPLIPLRVESIAYFKSFLNSDDFFDFPNTFGTSTDSHFADALWLCSRMLIQCPHKLASSQMVIFTNNEQPHSPGSAQLQRAFQRAKDMLEIGIDVSIVPMVDTFNYDLFFKEFLCVADGTDTDTFRYIPPAKQRQNLLDRLMWKNHRRTCLRHMTFHIGNDLEIGCDIHSFIQKRLKPASIQIHRETNEIALSKRSYCLATKNPNANDAGSVCDEDDNDSEGHSQLEHRRLYSGECDFYQEFGGKRITFTSEELAQIKTLFEPGIRLLGFKPLENLPKRFFVRNCQFLYPSESSIQGSTKLFRALWEKCIERQKYALCTLTLMHKHAPQYVALVPQTEADDGNDGFKIVYLPVESKCCTVRLWSVVKKEKAIKFHLRRRLQSFIDFGRCCLRASTGCS